MAIEAARLFVSIGAEMDGLKKGLKESNSDLVSFGNSMMSVGGKMTAVLTAPALLAGGAMLKIGMAAEQNKIAFETLLGSAQEASSFLSELRDFAAATPFQFTELVDASKRMLAFGFASEKVIPMLTTIGDAVSGLGLGSEGVNRVTLALGQMSAKGKVSAQEMMQLTEAGIPAWKYLADAMGLSTAEVMKMTEQGLIPAGEAIDNLLAGMNSQFGGNMANQSKSTQLSLSNLRDELEGLAEDMSTLFLPAFKDMVNSARDLVTAFSNLDPGAQKLIINLGLVAAAVGPVMTGIGGMIKFSDDFGKIIEKTPLVLGKLVDGVKAFGSTIGLLWPRSTMVYGVVFR
jgi:tape measure domain-containing protein